MRKGRYLAPWHREVGDLAALGGVDLEELGEEDLAALLEGLRGKPAIYHCISRVVNREFVLHREEKERFVALMRDYERFCQVQVMTFVVMSNHFHILLEVPAAPEDRGASWSDEELLDHLAHLYTEREMGELRWELGHYRKQKMTAAAEEFRKRYFDRMWDLSSFMKVLKQRFTQWFNKKHGRDGYLWSGRFKSVLVEDGHAARTVAAYIDLNPVRAGMVEDPKDYRWSGYGEAVAGKAAARDGLRLVMFENLSCAGSEKTAARKVVSWRKVARRYREVLFVAGEEELSSCGPPQGRTAASRGSHGGGNGGRRRGFSPEEVERVLEEGGSLSEGAMLRCKARYFVDGLVIGSAGFVDGVFALTRGYFGANRKSGARKIRGVRTELRTMRDLQLDALVV